MLLRSFWKTAIWVVIITTLSLIPSGGDDIPFIAIPHFDKAVHFIFYGVFSFLLLQGLDLYKPDFGIARLIFLTILIAVVYGGLMELVQLVAVPTRHGDLFDLLSNAGGCVFGVVFYRIYSFRFL